MIDRTAPEVVAMAQQLRALLHGVGATATLDLVAVGDQTSADIEWARGLDCDATVSLAHPALEPYTQGAWVEALADAAENEGWRVILLAHRYRNVEILGRLAGRLGAVPIPEVFEITLGEHPPDDRGIRDVVFTRPVFEGRLWADVRAPEEGALVVTVQAGASGEAALSPGVAAATRSFVPRRPPRPDRQVLGIESPPDGSVDLSAAQRLVSVGRGIGGPEALPVLEALAEAFAAELAASRPVVDAGWLPRERQVGSSGQTVAPRVYLAVGISGAMQHLAGMKRSAAVVAINSDAEAPIWRVADYGILGDLHEVVPALIAELRRRRVDLA